MPAGDYQGTYAAEKVIITVGPVIVTGFTDGDFVTVKFDEDRYTHKAGADGEVGRAKNASKAGTIEITLSATSAANDELSALFHLDNLAGIDNPIPIGVADLSGRSLAGAAKAWIKTSPDMTFGKDVGERVWTLQAAGLAINYGGNS